MVNGYWIAKCLNPIFQKCREDFSSPAILKELRFKDQFSINRGGELILESPLLSD
jgi:hypothetical protein